MPQLQNAYSLLLLLEASFKHIYVSQNTGWSCFIPMYIYVFCTLFAWTHFICSVSEPGQAILMCLIWAGRTMLHPHQALSCTMNGWSNQPPSSDDLMADSLRPPPSPSSFGPISIAASSRRKEERKRMKATVRGRYEVNKSAAAAAFALHVGDARLKASVTEATFANGASLEDLVLSLEKPGAFILDYNVADKDVRFQFMNSFKAADKTVNLTYTHAGAANRTVVDGSLVFDPANKVSLCYAFGSGNCKVKYWYAHGELKRTLLEPCYDVSKNAWDFALTRKFDGGDSLKAIYHTTTKNLGLEWNRDSLEKGCFKISASFNLAEKQVTSKLMVESTWNYEI